jgi:hypothetical protein
MTGFESLMSFLRAVPYTHDIDKIKGLLNLRLIVCKNGALTRLIPCAWQVSVFSAAFSQWRADGRL